MVQGSRDVEWTVKIATFVKEFGSLLLERVFN